MHKHRATPTTRQAFKSKGVSVPAVGGQLALHMHTHLTERGTRCTEAGEQCCAAGGENWRVGIGCAQVTRPGSKKQERAFGSCELEVDFANRKETGMNDETTYVTTCLPIAVVAATAVVKPLIVATAAGWQPC